MSIETLQLQEFIEYFSGAKYNFGNFIPDKSVLEKGSKKDGKAFTVKGKLITLENYKKHLNGEVGLGIIPINESNKCRFAVIDVDIYNKDLTCYIEAIEKNNFPLVPFKSKSGGLHLYVFFSEDTVVSSAILQLRKLSFLLSIDILVKHEKNSIVEIFPKQIKVTEKEPGNWINLPYFNCEKTVAYAVRNNKPLQLSEALLYIKEKQTTLEELDEFIKLIPYNDAPPCLQLAYILNTTNENTGRNNYLFSFGVYFKKKNEDFFEQDLYILNGTLKFPLKEEEVKRTIASSLKKRNYIYKCKDTPCVDFCNKKECKQREFGVGKDDGYFSSVEYGQLLQYKTFQPYYEWEIKLHGQSGFRKLRFKSEDEIIRQDTFLKLCMRELYELPSKLKQSEWFNQINLALKEIKIIEVSQEDDTSPIMILKSLFIDFLTSRAMAMTKDQIMAKRVYYKPEEESYYFRVKDLNEFLFIQKQFKYFSPTELHAVLREFGCEQRKINTESRKQLRVLAIHKEKISNYVDDKEFTPDFDKYSDDMETF